MQAKDAQAGEVGRGGHEVEVGSDLGQAADPHAAAAVAAADQVGELALHLGPGRAVVGGTVGVGVAGAGLGQLVLVGGDRDGAAGLRAGALAAKRAALAGRAEAGLAVVAVARVRVVDDRGGAPRRAGDRALVKVDVELVLGEVPAGRDRSLDLDPWVDAGGRQAGQQRPGPVGAVAVDRGRGAWGSPPAADAAVGAWATSSASNVGAAAASPRLPAVAVVAVTSSLSGSTEAWPL